MNAHVHDFVVDGTYVYVDQSNTAKATIVDRPCGFGKSTQIINSFRKDRRYLVVLPTLDEINNRYIPETDRLYGEGFFKTPSTVEKSTKFDHLEELLVEGHNIITTHKLYMDIVSLARDGLLKDYEVIIDEVLDCVKQHPGVKKKTWDKIYNGQYAEIDGTGKVIIKPELTEDVEDMDDALSINFYKSARAGCLYLVQNKFWLWTLPRELFTLSKSVTVYTYQAEGTLMLPYLRKIGVEVFHDFDPSHEAEMKAKCRDLITVKSIQSLSKIALSDNRQDSYSAKSEAAKRVATALSTIRRRHLPKGFDLSKLLITCKKKNWYHKAKGPRETDKPRAGSFAARSSLFKGSNWIPNTTRGTNDYRHCTHLIYLYNQHPATSVVNWLDLDEGYQSIASRYALSELIQWVFRSQVRDGKPITLYLPCERMRKIFQDWMNS